MSCFWILHRAHAKHRAVLQIVGFPNIQAREKLARLRGAMRKVAFRMRAEEREHGHQVSSRHKINIGNFLVVHSIHTSHRYICIYVYHPKEEDDMTLKSVKSYSIKYFSGVRCGENKQTRSARMARMELSDVVSLPFTRPVTRENSASSGKKTSGGLQCKMFPFEETIWGLAEGCPKRLAAPKVTKTNLGESSHGSRKDPPFFEKVLCFCTELLLVSGLFFISLGDWWNLGLRLLKKLIFQY